VSAGSEPSPPLTPAQRRFLELLQRLASEGITQQEVARRCGVPPQYVSDVKGGRRSLTELFARRIDEEFGVDYEWLRGDTEPSQSGRSVRMGGRARSNLIRLPVFPNPIEGEPYSHPSWDGSEIDLCGAAVTRLITADLPYVLRFGAHDRVGRLRKDDLVLISQASSQDAEIHVLQSNKTLFLARRNRASGWEPLVRGKRMLAPLIVRGHCVGIVWGSLHDQPRD